MIKKNLLLFLIFFCVPGFAAERTLSIVGVYSQSKVNFELETNSPFYTGGESQADSSINFGVLLETELKGRWGFETGLIFLQRGYQLVDQMDSSKQTYRWKSLYVPIVGRFHPTPFFTGSIGMYLNQSIGDVASFNSKTPKNISYQTMKEHGYRKLDYGITYSAGVNWKVSASTTFKHFNSSVGIRMEKSRIRKKNKISLP